MTSSWKSAQKAPFTGAFFFALIIVLAQSGVAPAWAACAVAQYDKTVQVAQVLDGDTIRLQDGRKVRLMGVNTPERAHENRPAQPLAQEATEFLSALLAGQSVQLKFGPQRHDRHGRLLAHVFNYRGENVAEQLLRSGLGFAIVVPPNSELANCYFAAESKARQYKKGVWSRSEFASRPAEQIHATGFQIVEGRITGIGLGRKVVWLDMGKQFALRIRREDLLNFSSPRPNDLMGKRVRVRGWVAFYNHKFRMTLKHEFMIQRLDE